MEPVRLRVPTSSSNISHFWARLSTHIFYTLYIYFILYTAVCALKKCFRNQSFAFYLHVYFPSSGVIIRGCKICWLKIWVTLFKHHLLFSTSRLIIERSVRRFFKWIPWWRHLGMRARPSTITPAASGSTWRWSSHLQGRWWVLRSLSIFWRNQESSNRPCEKPLGLDQWPFLTWITIHSFYFLLQGREKLPYILLHLCWSLPSRQPQEIQATQQNCPQVCVYLQWISVMLLQIVYLQSRWLRSEIQVTFSALSDTLIVLMVR